MEHTNLISLAEFARLHNLDPSTARKKAECGNWKTAVKIGRNWLIDKNEPHTDLRRNEIYNVNKEKGIKMKFFYIYDEMDNTKAVVILNLAVRIWRNGIKSYKTRTGANRYLRAIAEEKAQLPVEPDEIIKPEPGETVEDLEDRTVGEMFGHIGYFERIFPKDPKEALDAPVTYYKSYTSFMGQDIWYKTEAEAKKDADNIDTVYLGPVEVYDREVIEEIEKEISSYPANN